MNAPIGQMVAAGTVGASSVARSHVGLVRTLNEDRVFNCPEAGLWAIADGMGGHQGGDIAAQTVIDALRDLVRDGGVPSFDQALDALYRADEAIRQRNERGGYESGATVVLAMFDAADLRLAWAGDSRAYAVSHRRAAQLTHDHSLVQELVDAGLLTPEAALKHPQANVVTRALGVSGDLVIETLTVAASKLLLCSDGLSRSLDANELPDAVSDEALADLLIARALVADGSDNISLILIDPGE